MKLARPSQKLKVMHCGIVELHRIYGQVVLYACKSVVVVR